MKAITPITQYTAAEMPRKTPASAPNAVGSTRAEDHLDRSGTLSKQWGSLQPSYPSLPPYVRI